jgi:hypothetical protein
MLGGFVFGWYCPSPAKLVGGSTFFARGDVWRGKAYGWKAPHPLRLIEVSDSSQPSPETGREN